METGSLPRDLEELMEHHGHLCFGVLIGYKAYKYAVEIIGESAQMSVKAENGGCGNDAVRFFLNCTEENGRLTDVKGKRQSWCFYNHTEEEGVCLILNPQIKSLLPGEKDQAEKFLAEAPGSTLFCVEPYNL